MLALDRWLSADNISLMLSTDNRAELGRILTDIGCYLDDNPPALSLPPSAYTSPELWQLERERIFNRSWMLVAHVDQLAETGDYVAVSIAGERVMVVRGGDGELRAISPICRHRMMPLVETGAGRTDTLTCQYHMWRYGLDGRLRGAPHMAANKDFNPRDCRLPQFAVATWNGLVWVNLDADAEAIGAHLDLANDEFASYRLAEMVQVESWSHEWRANWKLASENGHENYHVLGLHRQTLEPLVPGGGDLDVRQYSPWALRIRVPFTFPLDVKSLQLNEVQKSNLSVLWTFPNSALAAAGERVVWFGFIPLSIDRVQVLGGVLTTPELAADSAATAQTAQFVTAMINDEDRLGLEGVQVGAGSRFAERGHLSPKEQPGMLAFYRNLAEALGGDQTGSG
ncbi:Anthranilate 1,2-dioxygenase large subunit [Mycobacterium simulans]|uniref:Anthranilate 1,2-dioxygenase large subunit n=2 Tax=Mycobacterium simulans TaxID=627089 RepID=A0A7Z7N970_9MYCO|nr:Anthranilate 1,2-dioxygenase large subunit [Mycobacterium simulans]